MIEKNIVNIIINDCLGYKKPETLLIVCDDDSNGLGLDFYKAARSFGVDCLLTEMPPAKTHGQEPPETVAIAMARTDIALLVTSKSLSHTKARKIASSKFGTRIASLPGATPGMLTRSIPVDYDALKIKAGKLSSILTKGEKLEIRTKKGTSLIMSIKGRKGFADSGVYKIKGSFGNLPAGEACIGPREGTANGRLIVDASAPFKGELEEPLDMVIENGYLKEVSLPSMAELVKKFGREVLNIAEVGIGLNPAAQVTGNILEDEKVLKTAHIAFGNNISFGGHVDCPSHLDFVFFKPEILIDGKRIEHD